MQKSMALTLLVLLGNSILADGYSLRQQSVALKKDPVPAAKVHDDVSYKVVEKSSIGKEGTTDCLCKLGSFWHWRIKSCVEQGPWSYECGFFPAEHHDKVCQDKYQCEVLKTKNNVTYGAHGAVPASCQPCSKDDKCLTGKERHAESCMKEYKLSGSACQTVRVTVKATAAAKVTEQVTKSSEATATSTATAAEKAISKVGSVVESAMKKATAQGEATAKAEGTGKATAEAQATKEGVAEEKACVTLEEVKEHLKLTNVPRIGAVLSAKVVSTGDEMAFDKAYDKALAAARKAGLMSAEEAAKAKAAAEAREHAGIEAEGKADEAAAWKAEAGADKDAQAKAKAEALAKARDAARKEAEETAKAAARAAAKADIGAGTKEEADAAAAKAAAAKAAADAMEDLMNPTPTQAPIKPKPAEPTNAPRKITADEQAAALP